MIVYKRLHSNNSFKLVYIQL